jgi:hypothetical protein
MNTEYAIAVGQVLLDYGYAPMVPHLTHFWDARYHNDWSVWMKLDLPWVARADLVLRLPGASDGADAECRFARSLGIPVFEIRSRIGKLNGSGSGTYGLDATTLLELRRFRNAYAPFLRTSSQDQRGAAASPEVAAPREVESRAPQAVRDALKRIAKVFESKNADYADDRDWKSNFVDVAEQLGFDHHTAAEVLIAVKQARLKSLRVNGRTPVNEAVIDTVLDRAVYSVIALAMQIEDTAEEAS